MGIAIGLIPTVLVFAFLSYDDGFLKILGNIFSFGGESTLHLVRDLICTVPMAMYGFGLYISSQSKLMHDEMSLDRCENGLKSTKILPQLTALVAVVPIVFLYGVFFVSQWTYYISGFTGVLPANFSYAEYARQGFFELCSVSVINLVIIVAVAFFIRRGKNGSSAILKIVAVVFCLCTLILISTAVAKLVMYIDYYGLTQKRIYAMWLMALIGIVFLLIALGQFLRKVKVVALCLSVFVVMFACLAVCNVNALCARYNADRYLSGTLSTLDISAMEELGDSAIPSLVRVATSDASDPDLKRKVDALLERKIAQSRERSVFAFSVPSAMADAALEEYQGQR